MTSMAQQKHLFLIDGSGFIFRAFHALPIMTRSDGTPVNAVFGYTKMLMKLVDDTDADYIAVIFDKARKTFRNDIYPDYKANRPPPPEELIPQFQLVRDATLALNVSSIDLEGFEADDLIATYAKQAEERGMQVTIVSSDKDLMQLVTDSVKMFDAMKNRQIGRSEVIDKFGVLPEKVIDVQALAGDSSDNVPGVQGIGIKTAAELITEFGDLETLLSNAGQIKQPKRREKLLEQAEIARVSRALVTLRKDVPVPISLDTFKKKICDTNTLLEFVSAQNFKSLIPSIAKKSHISDKNIGTFSNRLENNYELVQDEETLQKWVRNGMQAHVVAVDTETTSLNPLQAGLVGISLALGSGSACYIPLAHKGLKNQGMLNLSENDEGVDADCIQIPMGRAIELLKPLLEAKSVLKVGQNIKYDNQVLNRFGVEIAPFDDTMLISYVLAGGLHSHGMDELANRYLDYHTIKFSDVVGTGKNKLTFDEVAIEKALEYAAEDADITLRLHQKLKPQLVSDRMVTVYETLERPLVPILASMERIGVKIDAVQLKSLSDEFATRINMLEEKIYKLAGRTFNVGSPKQLGEILFDEHGLKGGKKSKTGAWSTSADVLEELAAAGNELPAKALDWRQLAKLKNTYTDALINDINIETGRVHTSYSQAVTSTGRLSSNDPNLQNIPIRSEDGRKIRRAFVPEEQCVFMSADYSQIELRLLAHVANVESLKEAFKEGQDIHALTASEIFNVSLDTMDANTRRKAKAINFGIIYGISAFGLARQLGITNSEAAKYIEIYFSRYPGIRDYMEKTKVQAQKTGAVFTPFGRKCHMRGINDKNPNIRGMAERAAINAPIQGGAADIIKIAMIRMPKALKSNKLNAKMLLQVHDELIFEVPKIEIERTQKTVIEVMEKTFLLDVPLVVDIGIGNNWDEAH